MKTIFSIFVIASFPFFIASCDKIEGPYMNENNTVDTAECPVPDFPAFSNPQHKVLLEEFTGHKCPNCPIGASTAHDLLVTYADQLAVVAFHAGYFATPDNNGDFTANYSTTEGEELATYFSVIANPIGLVNRKKFNSAFLINPGDWNTAISNIISQSPQMYLQTISQSKNQDSSFCIHTKINYLENMSGNFNLCVLITEDSIISPQKTNDPNYPSGTISNFSHNHVFRKVLGGLWGKCIATTQVYKDSAYVQSYKLIPQPAWNLTHCEIISFVYNTDTEEIIQVDKTSLLDN